VTGDSAWILVVDDDPINRQMLTRLLEQDGYRVDTASDGERGLEMLQADPFDIVLLDLVMPGIDGYEVLTRIKADEALKHLPVLMITAVDDVGSAARCIEAGAEDYLPKPFDAVVLRARINASLSRKRVHDLEAQHLAEMARLNRRLESRIEEQMAELVRTGELRRFLPNQVAESLLAGALTPEDHFERRKVTALFADLVGFTDLSDSLEPEELAEVLNAYLREMTAVAVRHGGALDSFIGDGLMVIFGAPAASGEAEQALAAVQTAIGMRSRMRELATELGRRGLPGNLQIRAGINTGHCTVGVFGSEVMRAYKAVGFAVNIASRLQSAAEPGGILCGYRTYALVEGQVRAERREPLQVKGSARPIEAWEIIDIADRARVAAAEAKSTSID
jgi:adenylate cyclase